MALKGTTKIELTNVKTGGVEVYEKHNLVTNAVPSLLENPFAWQLKTPVQNDRFTGHIFPLYWNLFGGILLYKNPIPEDVNQIYAQSDNALVGYSNITTNTGADTMRGSLNKTESGLLDTNDGYRFVYDFNTSQANGIISSVGLTSKFGGIAGHGSEYQKNTQSPGVCYNEAIIADRTIVYAYVSILHYDEKTGIATSAYVSGQKMITVTRIKLNTKEWNLTGDMNIVDQKRVIETQWIETKVFAGTMVDGGKLFYNLCDDGDGYIWGFEHAGNVEGNAEGNATINWIKIKIDDLTVEEGTWDISAQIYAMGVYPNGIETGSGVGPTANCVILDGYLYCIKYDKTGLYKIDLSNPTNIKFIEYPDGEIYAASASSFPYYFYYSTANLTVAGNKVCMWNGWVNGDIIVRNLYNFNSATTTYRLADGWIDDCEAGYPRRNACGITGLRLGAFLLYFTGIATRDKDAHIYGQILLDAPYLATINNLPAPVEKTADKTMKITYIIRETQPTSEETGQ